MAMKRDVLGFLALAPIALLASRTARADVSSLPLSAEPLVQIQNCPFDPLRPHQLRCLSSRLVPKSYADELALRPFSPAPDAGAGVDASADIGSCNGSAPGGGGGSASGFGPADYTKMYNIAASPTGAGRIVAIVDACADATVVTDLAAYRLHYGLPVLPECGSAAGHAPTPNGTACIGVISQRGDGALPAQDSGWAGEIALDVEMVSAACPDCSILLVEADSPNSWDLGPAVSKAVELGASAVSNSYGAPEDPSDPYGPSYSDGPYVPYFQHEGVLIAVASGDALYNNETGQSGVLAPSFPSTIDSVLSVGGTTPSKGSGAARGGYTEKVWNQLGGGTTSGCSSETAKPAYQSGVDTGSCAMRADVDVSAVASNVATYVGGGWTPVGGTSCASPFVAALLTRVGLASKSNAFFYENTAAFYDVTSGNNNALGSTSCGDVMCLAGTGWDGPTGWGSPNGTALADLGATDAGASDAGHEADAGHASDAGHGADAAGGEDATTGGGSDASDDATLGNDGSGGGDDDAATGTGDDAATSGGDDAGGTGNGSSSGGGSGSSSGGLTTGEDGGSIAADGGNGDTGTSSGCGCATVGSRSTPREPAGIALVIGALAIVARRRRRG